MTQANPSEKEHIRNMAFATGKKGTINERDSALLMDLYLVTYMTTQQVVDVHFTDPSKAYRRLPKLVEKGWIHWRSSPGSRSTS